MSKYFRPWNIDQTLLLPPSVQDFVAKDHVSRGLVRESLDLKEITGSYVSGLGQPPFDPRMMVALLLHGYASGLYSSRRIARACRERNDFVMIVALDPPDFRTISDFRKRHLKTLGALFLQVLKLCETAGLLTGKVHALVRDRHRSREFIEFLKCLDAAYPASTAIKLILDNHSAHISRETTAWLDARPPGRFEFTFTPKHGSWLNLIEGFFSKFARSVLRHIRVTSKHELKERIMAGIDDVNRHPVIHTWSYKLADAA